MKILWFTWKDLTHPQAGGAELVNQELAKRLVANGHQVIFLVGGYPNCKSQESIDGYKIIRLGNKITTYWQAAKYYQKNLKTWPDLVIEEINTIPYLTKLFVQQPKYLFIHQLCREIWFQQMFFPINLIGYLLEPVYLDMLKDMKVITVSQSTKNDLIGYKFNAEQIHIISEGIKFEPLKELNSIQKNLSPTILGLGSIRSMKRTGHIINAFEIAKKEIPNLQLIIAGQAEGKYGQKIIKQLQKSPFQASIKYLGKVNEQKKIELLQQAHLICVTSVKEGWGLTVTEANSQGTPAIVYNADGLRDSVQDQKTGIICQQNTPQNLAQNIIQLLNNQEKYQQLQTNAWEWSKTINFEQSY